MPDFYDRAGGEGLVNTTTDQNQNDPGIAVFADGSYVVVWTDSSGGVAAEADVKGQLFDAESEKVGGEFLVNTVTADVQAGAQVATLASGGFVVTWSDFSGEGGDASRSGVMAQRFDAGATRIGSEFLVNSVTDDFQLSPAVTALAGGGFVISWSDSSTLADGGGTSVRAQVYDSAGMALGDEILVNSTADGGVPSVAALATGGFAVAWSGFDPSAGTQSVFLRQFDSAGDAAGAEQKVNAGGNGPQIAASIAATESGFVIAWSGASDTSGSSQIKAQLFDTTGARTGEELLISLPAETGAQQPSVAGVPGGGFVVTWSQSPTSGAESDIRGRVLGPDGSRLGNEFVVNAATAGHQTTSQVVALPSGELAIVFADNGGTSGDASGFAVKLQIVASTDTLVGSPGDDVLSGGPGDNEIFGLEGDDVLDGAMGSDLLDGGAGSDTASYATSAAGVDVDLTRIGAQLGGAAEGDTLSNIENLTGSGHADALTGDDADNLLSGGEGDDLIDGGGGNDTVMGGDGADLLNGGTGNDTLVGDAGADQLDGGDDDDILIGGDGADLIDGGDGTDTASYETSAAGVDVDLTRPGAQTGGDAEGDILTSIENLAGSANADTLTGDGAANALSGGDGNDRLDGGSGADTMRGGTGDDSYVVEQAGDRVIEAGGQGTDTVSSSIGYTLPVHVENLILTGAAALDGTGNGHANQLVGNGAGNVLDGRGGVDTMRGAAGDDTYIVDNIGDRVVELASQGTDTVRSSVNYTLSDNVENLALTDAGIINGTGNSRANVISGNAKANVLDGAGGADAMRGGKGHDTYVVENAADQVIERADEGTDTIRSYVSYVLPDHVEALGLGGAGVTNATGNGLTNRLYGNAKANVLDGAGGADTMKGRSGHDIYHVDHANDSVVEVHGEGSDTVRAWVSYTLANHVENLVLTGAAAINGTGNGHGNQLIGNSAANLLDGARGKDLMRGGHGNDTYIVDHSADSVVELAGQGIDRVRSSVSHTLSQHVENLSLEGSAEINGTGNALANQLTGNRAKNLLDGGSGADVMRGGFGNDTYVVDVAGDQVIELANEGWDRVKSAISYTLGDNLEGLALTGQAAINGTGNALANKIVGNRGANILDGRGGADVMQGGVGNDIYVVDHAGDQVIEADGGGVDTVKSSVSFSLADQYADNLTLTGSAAIDGTGNALANRLVGNGAANVLNGAGGEDRIRGGGGSDSFLFTARPSAANAAQIEDFVAGDDRILLGGLAGQPFEALASGALGAHAFRTGTAAADADDRIIYNRSTGQLSFDADGAGGADAVRFAILEPGLSLTAGDFLVTGPANRLPTFSSGASASIAENSAASTIVYQARASDPDGDAIAYALSGRDAGLFTIDASGAVRLIAPADYESRTSYSLTAIARDSGPTAVTRDVAVNVTNVADVGATPILNETTRQNGGFESAQAVERLLLRPSNNSSLWNDDLPSVTIRGNISAPGDADFFSITLQKDEMLVLDVDFSEGDLDALIKVYHPITGAPLVVEDDLVVPDPGSAPHPEYGHNTDPLVRFRAPQAGTYLFSIEAFQDAANPTSGSYHLNVSVGPFVSEAELHEENIQAMLSGTSWSRIFVTYGFPTREADYARGEWEEEIAAGMEALNLQQQRAVRTIVDGIADLTNLDFYMGSPETADLRYALSNSPETAFAAYPGPGIGGDSWYNRLDYGSPKAGNYDWLGFLHETGHALGLKHPHEAPAVSIDRDMLAYTVMSYRSFATAPLDETGGYTNETWGFPQTYMMYDIAALQRLYGADFTFNSANTTYRWNPDTGAFMIDGEVEWTPGANRVFMTIWDGGGTDTYDLSNYKTNTLIDLRPGQWSRTSDDQLANTGSPNGHWPPGNVANALQFNGDTRSLIENAVGGSGWDWLIANQTANRLTGGAGRDRFVWNSIDDSRPGQADTITDFKRFDDLIDLEMIDADTSTPSDDLFQFIGSNAFSGRAGELRYAAGGNGLRLLGDVDGDGAADLEIVVANQTTLTAVDFQF